MKNVKKSSVGRTILKKKFNRLKQRTKPKKNHKKSSVSSTKQQNPKKNAEKKFSRFKQTTKSKKNAETRSNRLKSGNARSKQNSKLTISTNTNYC